MIESQASMKDSVSAADESGKPNFIRKHRSGFVIPQERSWSPLRHALTHLLIVAGVLALWESGVQAGLVNEFFWSSPSQILAKGLVFVTQGKAFYDIWFTVKSTLLGFVAGTVGGAAIGLSLWWSRNLSAIVEPYLIIFNAVPKVAFAPLLILIFGIGIASKIALAVALTIIVTALATHAGIKTIDRDLVRMMYSLGARRWGIFLKVVIPSAMPWIASSLRINIGLALTGAVMGEFISSQFGLGKMILFASTTYDMALVWVGIIILSIVAVTMYWLVTKLEMILLKGMHHDDTN